MSPLFQMEHTMWFNNMGFGLRVSGKRGACYLHGYDPGQLYDTFLEPSLCNCYERRYNKQYCIWNPPQTIALYYRCPGSLTHTQMRTLNKSLLRRRVTVHIHHRVILCVLEALPSALNKPLLRQRSTRLHTASRHCPLVDWWHQITSEWVVWHHENNSRVEGFKVGRTAET